MSSQNRETIGSSTTACYRVSAWPALPAAYPAKASEPETNSANAKSGLLGLDLQVRLCDTLNS